MLEGPTTRSRPSQFQNYAKKPNIVGFLVHGFWSHALNALLLRFDMFLVVSGTKEPKLEFFFFDVQNKKICLMFSEIELNLLLLFFLGE